MKIGRYYITGYYSMDPFPKLCILHNNYYSVMYSMFTFLCKIYPSFEEMSISVIKLCWFRAVILEVVMLSSYALNGSLETIGDVIYNTVELNVV